MTMSTSSQEFEAYLPPFDVIPRDWEEARGQLEEYLKKVSDAVNVREIGWLLDEELLSGKQLYPSGTDDQNEFRSVFRKTFDFGALPNNTTKTMAHGINVDANFSNLGLSLHASDTVGLTGFSLMYWDKTGSASITISYDSTNIIVKTTSNYSNFNNCNVIWEYCSEA